MAVDREFEYIVWRPAFVRCALHVNLGAASLEKHRVFGGCMSESLIFLWLLKRLALKVFKNLVFFKVHMRNFDRGLSFRSAERSNTIGVIQNASSSSEMYVFLWFLNIFSPLTPKMLVILRLFDHFLWKCWFSFSCWSKIDSPALNILVFLLFFAHFLMKCQFSSVFSSEIH